ncbi:DUF4870 domain-containing protein [Haloferula sp. BvORR071]|uniref:DUF4870 domain-containing protein n=1 Tax=Haloferula sp. BvORR071 TaxID=1396141 RepID=UPI0005557680|nr:DUF4870 domain-containing protein [Haloferula sp. BvORR071]
MNDPFTPPAVSEVVAPPAPAELGVVSSEEKMWATIAHLSALTGWITGFGYIAGPLIVYLVKKDTMPFAAKEAKEALNFNITWLGITIIFAVVTFVLSLFVIGLLLIPILIAIPVVMTVLSIVGGLRANEGRSYRYPLTLRLID